MIYAAPSTSFEARVEGLPTGLAGTVGVRLLDNQSGTPVARTTVGIIEDPAGSGSYVATLTAPATLGQYSVAWDNGGTPPLWAFDDLLVTATGEPPPPLPATPAGITPSLADVGALLRARTVDAAGVQQGTFTDDTRPTAAEAQTLIDRAVAWVVLRVGDAPVDALVAPAREAAAIRAAMMVELSYFPEQTRVDNTVYQQLKLLWDEAVAELDRARMALGVDEEPGTADDLTTGLPAWRFDDLGPPFHAPGSELPCVPSTYMDW